MTRVACASSFVILFCGFLFFSDLLTTKDSAIVLWFTAGAVEVHSPVPSILTPQLSP